MNDGVGFGIISLNTTLTSKTDTNVEALYDFP